ncbi:MAG: deoxyribodipyrimidine photolyase [Thermoanaerobaculia bacterium]
MTLPGPSIPADRLTVRRDLAPAAGECVLYWMTSARRLEWNYALDRALDWARALDRPLVVLEALRCDYPWASARLHRFVLDGMAENAARAAASGIAYHPYVEPARGAGGGLLAALAERAAVVVGDDFPAFFLPRMTARAAAIVPCRFETVDANGLLPLASSTAAYPTAYAFRRFLQANLKRHLAALPEPAPLAAADLPRGGRVPEAIQRRWPAASPSLLAGDAAELAALPIDRSVAPVADRRGGAVAARERLESFVSAGLARYAEERNHPDADAGSGLSPYLHFGHLSTHAVLARLAREFHWSVEDLPERGVGARQGWWRMPPAAESFLDELVTWRELGYHFCARRPDDHDAYESLPAWARATLEKHAGDPRRSTYDLAELEGAATHDPLWNAAQRELVTTGRLHSYLRMLWGKKILEWSSDPRSALATMFHLNDKYALDGRDPNSTSGILWCLGRFDRPWAPERAIFGVVRYLSSDNTARKLRLKEYLKRHAPGAEGATS